MPDDTPERIDLPQSVLDELQERQEKQQELVQAAQEKFQDFEEARDEAERHIESLNNYLQGIGQMNGVDIENYVVDGQGLRRLTEEEKRQMERQQAPQGENDAPVPPQSSTDLPLGEAVERAAELPPEQAAEFVAGEEREPVLQAARGEA